MLWLGTCFTLCVSHPHFSRRLETRRKRELKDNNEIWLQDEEETALPGQMCPFSPQVVQKASCDFPKCLTDSECKEGQKCCDNGCILTCQESISPPAVLDWITEPQRKTQDGRSWLIDGPEEPQPAEPCSTMKMPGDDAVLECPHNYVCQLESLGDREMGIPNRGICVAISRTFIKPRSKGIHYHTYQVQTEGDSEHDCDVGDEKHKHGEMFVKARHLCLCQDKMVRCAVAHKINETADHSIPLPDFWYSAKEAKQSISQTRDTSSGQELQSLLEDQLVKANKDYLPRWQHREYNGYENKEDRDDWYDEDYDEYYDDSGYENDDDSEYYNVSVNENDDSYYHSEEEHYYTDRYIE